MLTGTYRFKLYVPMDCLSQVDSQALQKALIGAAGGFTRYPKAIGQWKNADGQVIAEEIDVFEIIGPETLAPIIGSLAEDVKFQGKQELVLWTVEEIQAEFV